jgi:hypothetical protein
MELPLWAVLSTISGAVLLLLCLVTCCAVRCFRPQNTRGPEWFVRRDGKEQLVQAPFKEGREQKDDNNWLRVKNTTIPTVSGAV